MPIAQLEYQLDDSILTQRTLRLRIGETDVQSFCDQEAFRLSKKVVVPGFRKGKGPLALLRQHYWKQIEGRAFLELKRAALDQVFSLLDRKHHPFLPPEILAPEKVRLLYGEPLEFSVKYMIDPTSITSNPAVPQPQQGALLPGPQTSHPGNMPLGVPAGPQLPAVQMPSTSPGVLAPEKN